MRVTDLLSFFTVLSSSTGVFGYVTLYGLPGQEPLGTGTATASGSAASYTGAAAYNPTILNPPPPPNPPGPSQFPIQLMSTGTQGLSIQQSGNFLGFSIEFSVVNQVLGKNSSFLQVPFLNLMSELSKRAGHVQIRVGGNTQETATLVPSLPDGKSIEKDYNASSNPTATPPLLFTPEIIYMMGNISALLPIEWYIGVPLNDTANLRLEIAELSQAVLGPNLKGMQVGNEPDLYANHGHRPTTYGPADYDTEFGIVAAALDNDKTITRPNILVGPSLSSIAWTPEQVWDTGFMTKHPELAYVSVEHYPLDNCFAQFGVGTPHVPQDEFASYLTHQSGKDIVAPFLNSSNLAQQVGKPFLMFETNTASCGGFAGISDSFGAALWGIDYGLQMAYSNFSGALVHVGGQSVFYNPFTPPPTNQSTFHQWTIGPLFYSSLIIAEAIGSTNKSQVLDLNPNAGNLLTPAYAIYENGAPVRVAMTNFITDPSGANDYTAMISIGGGQTGTPGATPATIKVKHFTADSVSQKANLSWAGQTFGDIFQSDGRPVGTETIETVTCDQTNNVCPVKVKAPGFALAFLTDTALQNSDSDGATATTFSTTARTRLRNTATVAPDVLATSNGHSGSTRGWGSTSNSNKILASGALVRVVVPGTLALLSMVCGAAMIGRMFVRV
ncbi:glycoside hydrolase family 79 protein [Rickenella mellea]|uniref:Glycoside hydrolase family 79 protein n=1 Tax=Rickenella mellea TaxID=50990 RepID=A0A4Y7Q085_9AGAM|nr:glycoside hydrolase family 79 protein [Rickenella mellea]